MHIVSSRIHPSKYTSSVELRSRDVTPLITEREKEVLYLVAYEHSAKEIAAALHISYETVCTHRKNIMTKLGVKNTAGMIRAAFQEEIITLS